ncbi:hypothetical protein BATDEDRAFT_89031 [Batrachochytrium dendrobatidis JAM81]|uniref:Uncharacterized protein n=2 Tax=Batrachochytrium dendrobatidis TaxID=109871 RepID=F4P4J2_BATDJ|nr:uncharacterized protein BATDEDRAFT_89031 [Batrachochytrium dendrobatidis JAM81]EGF79635.1 hypothetical protein BATDEDRAFT_89031 [Batrachochytrium dendrobatidis JAM81]OAJ38676.1 hypothetical protein BDEG_22584 [Batrachochytrium dendrobatidis JEL423]|eukprot:XP_006679625.1 hypothetical protein BATDEDRAFT_89031 [Batrachochytrium dendrobatidis JAM81]
MNTTWIDLLAQHPAIDSTANDTKLEPSTPLTKTQKPLNWGLADISAISMNSDSNATFDTSISYLPTPSKLTATTSNDFKEIPCFLDDIDGVTSHALLAQSDGNLFMCLNKKSGTLVRHIGLREWKRICTKATTDGTNEDIHAVYNHASWKDLVMPGLDFRVTQIQLNPTGRILALCGKRSVLIAVLPITLKSSVQSLECKTHKISNIISTSDHVHFISKCHWHPLSDTGAHLAVLTSDAVLRIYNVASSSKTPESSIVVNGDDQEINAIQSSQAWTNRHRFGSKMDDGEAVSFCFGVDQSMLDHEYDENDKMTRSKSAASWSPFTVYVLMRSGDIFSVCPVAPCRMHLSANFLNSLKVETELDWSISNTSDTLEQSSFYWRLKWIQNILDQMPMPDDDMTAHLSNINSDESDLYKNAGKTNTYFSCDLPTSMKRLQVKSCGPYLVQPCDPAHSYDNACDIVCMPSSVGVVFVVSSACGVVQILLEVDPVTPSWKLDNDTAINTLESESPVLALLETIDLKYPKELTGLDSVSKSKHAVSTGDITLLADPKYFDMFYAYHTMGVHCITLPNLDSLKKGESIAVDACSVRHLVLLQNSIATNTKQETSNPVKAVVGLTILTENVLGYSYLLMTSSNEIYGDALALRVVSNFPSFQTDLSATATIKDMKSPYKSALVDHPYQMPKFIQSGFPRRPKLVGHDGDKKTYPVFINPDSIANIAKQASIVSEDLQILYNAKGDLIEHLDRQVHEYAQQMTILDECTNRIDSLTTKQSCTHDRMKAVRERYAKTLTKVDLILQILVDQTQPELSIAEIKWMHELQGCRRGLSRDVAPSITEVGERAKEVIKKQQADDVQESIQRAERQQMSEVLGSSQILRIRNALHQEYKVISSTAMKMARLEAEMSGMN